MKKNVGSQVIGVQMVSATDGSAFTGSVTIKVCGDGGTQATGSVSSGACTHEGSGYHTYAPAQAETNYDQIGFTFTGTGAIPVTVQVFTDYPQTGDIYAARPTNFSSMSIDSSGRLDMIKVAGTTQTARDLGASVLLSSGTGTGQVVLSSGKVALTSAEHTAIAAEQMHVIASTTINSVTNTTTFVLNGGPENDLTGGMLAVFYKATSGEDGGEARSVRSVTSYSYDSPVRTLVVDSAPAFTITAGTSVYLLAISPRLATIQAKTDQLTFTVANELNVNARYWGGTAVAAAYVNADLGKVLGTALTEDETGVWAGTASNFFGGYNGTADVDIRDITNTYHKVDTEIAALLTTAHFDAVLDDSATLDDLYDGSQLQDDIGNGSGSSTVIPVSQVPVPLRRTWILVPSGDGLAGELPLIRTVGENQLFAIDFRNDLPTNGRLISIDELTLTSGTEDGIELLDGEDDRGVDHSQAKFRINLVAEGTYVIGCEVTFDDSDGGGTSQGAVTLIVRPSLV